MLGHSSITITLDTYSHVLPNMQEKAVEAVEEIIEVEGTLERVETLKNDSRSPPVLPYC